MVVPGVRPRCSASAGTGWVWGSVSALLPRHRQPQARDLPGAAPGRATESFTCTRSFKFSHFRKEYVQWPSRKMLLVGAECRQIHAQASGVVITVIF